MSAGGTGCLRARALQSAGNAPTVSARPPPRVLPARQGRSRPRVNGGTTLNWACCARSLPRSQLSDRRRCSGSEFIITTSAGQQAVAAHARRDRLEAPEHALRRHAARQGRDRMSGRADAGREPCAIAETRRSGRASGGRGGDPPGQPRLPSARPGVRGMAGRSPDAPSARAAARTVRSVPGGPNGGHDLLDDPLLFVLLAGGPFRRGGLSQLFRELVRG